MTINGCIDRESNPSYQLTIIAKDNPVDKRQQKTSSMTLTVTILDVNDNAPMFSPNSYVFSVREDTDIGKTFATVTATDSDIVGTCDGSKVTYSLNYTDDALFYIDNSTGELHTAADLKEKVGTYNLTVLASDCGDTPMQGQAFVEIHVTDVNLNPPNIANIPSNSEILVYEVMPFTTSAYCILVVLCIQHNVSQAQL